MAQKQTFRITTFFLLLAAAAACTCGGPMTVNNSLLQNPVAAKVSVAKELEQEQEEVTTKDIHFLVMPMWKYYTATVNQVFKDDGSNPHGKIVVKTAADGAMCGMALTEKTSYLLFGSIETEKVPGIEGEVPVLSIGSCSSNKPFGDLTKEEYEILKDFDPEDPKCYPDDCYPMMIPQIAALCPDMETISTSSAECIYYDGWCQTVLYEPTMEECPKCEANTDCKDAQFCDINNNMCTAKRNLRKGR